MEENKEELSIEEMFDRLEKIDKVEKQIMVVNGEETEA